MGSNKQNNGNFIAVPYKKQYRDLLTQDYEMVKPQSINHF
jgi:hypothetical protein